MACSVQFTRSRALPDRLLPAKHRRRIAEGSTRARVGDRAAASGARALFNAAEWPRIWRPSPGKGLRFLLAVWRRASTPRSPANGTTWRRP
jgi:hypothetical protein